MMSSAACAAPRTTPSVALGLSAFRVALGVDAPEALLERAATFESVDAETQRNDALWLRDWARYHGIVPAVSRALDAAASLSHAAPVPSALVVFQTMFQADARHVAARGLFQAQALRDALQRLAVAQIPCLPLKGSMLAARVYGSVGARKTGDHDLWVPPDRIADAARVFMDAGFRLPADAPLPETWIDRGRTSGTHDAPMLVHRSSDSPEGPAVGVELHWALHPAGLLPGDPIRHAQRVWARAQPTHVLGAPAWQMAPADELVYLCRHAVAHLACPTPQHAMRLAMLEDIARFARAHPDLSADEVLQRDGGGPFLTFLPPAHLWRLATGAPAHTLFGTMGPALLTALRQGRSRFGRGILLAGNDGALQRGARGVLLADTETPGMRPNGWAGLRDRVQRHLVAASLLRTPTARMWRHLQSAAVACWRRPAAPRRTS